MKFIDKFNEEFWCKGSVSNVKKMTLILYMMMVKMEQKNILTKISYC